MYTWKCHNEAPCIAILNNQKCLLFFPKNRTDCKTGPVWGLYQWEGGDYKESVEEVNMVEILCTHVWKWKNDTCWDHSRNGGEEKIKNVGEGEFNYDIL
jgi:hypothetical protein